MAEKITKPIPDEDKGIWLYAEFDPVTRSMSIKMRGWGPELLGFLACNAGHQITIQMQAQRENAATAAQNALQDAGEFGGISEGKGGEP
jgi:hypothetical protein